MMFVRIKKNNKPIIIFLIIGIIILGLIVTKKIRDRANNISEWSLNNFGEIDENDPSLEKTKILAQKNLSHFVSEFQNRNENQDEFYVKVKLTENEIEEHIWIDILILNDKHSIGLLDNDPIKFKMYKYLDTVSFNINDAEDLMIFKNDSLILGSFLLSELEKK